MGLDLGMKMLDKVDWEDVKETAKFYYTDSTTTLNLYPALILSVILLFLEPSQRLICFAVHQEVEDMVTVLQNPLMELQNHLMELQVTVTVLPVTQGTPGHRV